MLDIKNVRKIPCNAVPSGTEVDDCYYEFRVYDEADGRNWCTYAYKFDSFDEAVAFAEGLRLGTNWLVDMTRIRTISDTFSILTPEEEEAL